ncbi:hypothetical protein [Alteromonas flava]|uniref:hypothetical protein n=1 Tax=Alteromonas flava TaxID=2048003 RepID=UPI000C28B643|nr:hypothetical protein [Alteromonas flava]
MSVVISKDLRSELSKQAKIGGVEKVEDLLEETIELIEIHTEPTRTPEDGLSMSKKPSSHNRTLNALANGMHRAKDSFVELDESFKEKFEQALVMQLYKKAAHKLKDTDESRKLITTLMDIVSTPELFLILRDSAKYSIIKSIKIKREPLVYQFVHELLILWFKYGGKVTRSRSAWYRYLNLASNAIPQFYVDGHADRLQKYLSICENIQSSE